jgi:hypothetical protein
LGSVLKSGEAVKILHFFSYFVVVLLSIICFSLSRCELKTSAADYCVPVSMMVVSISAKFAIDFNGRSFGTRSVLAGLQAWERESPSVYMQKGEVWSN